MRANHCDLLQTVEIAETPTEMSAPQMSASLWIHPFCVELKDIVANNQAQHQERAHRKSLRRAGKVRRVPLGSAHHCSWCDAKAGNASQSTRERFCNAIAQYSKSGSGLSCKGNTATDSSVGGGGVGSRVTQWCAKSSRPRHTSAALCHRRFGSFARQLFTMRLSAVEARGCAMVSAGGSRSRMAAITFAWVAPSKARRPVVILYMTAPRANTFGLRVCLLRLPVARAPCS